MALYDLVAVSTATTGTGTLTLGSAVAGFRSFSGASIPNGTVVSYAIENGAQRETGTGTYTVAGSTLTRTLKASSTGALLNLGGTSTVFITALASDIQTRDEKAAANGYASLNSSGNVPSGQLNIASAATVKAGKSTTTVVSPANAAGAMAFTPLTDAATVAVDLDTGPNFTLLTTAGVGVGRTIGLPTNGNPGQFYTLTVTSDAAGRTLAWHTAFKWPKGSPKPITATSGGKDKFSFQMIDAARFEVVGLAEDIR